mmetsp:Transcript_45301/g.33080  ORF Transcript_45301/g.33080 Transcript_45301/m.33080 type:complete len:120 (-) Transcript_45301:44-403(-)
MIKSSSYISRIIKFSDPAIAVVVEVMFGSVFKSEEFTSLVRKVESTYEQIQLLQVEIVQNDLSKLSSSLTDFIIAFGDKYENGTYKMDAFDIICGYKLNTCFMNLGYLSSIFGSYLDKS